jgi:hypothetical protein
VHPVNNTLYQFMTIIPVLLTAVNWLRLGQCELSLLYNVMRIWHHLINVNSNHAARLEMNSPPLCLHQDSSCLRQSLDRYLFICKMLIIYLDSLIWRLMKIIWLYPPIRFLQMKTVVQEKLVWVEYYLHPPCSQSLAWCFGTRPSLFPNRAHILCLRLQI